ncbi:MAG: hypothetical protein HOL15_09690 [Nitrospinaceae bacterium]|nr:hypothetical protein [Nitrospinaceae bacterium]
MVHFYSATLVRIYSALDKVASKVIDVLQKNIDGAVKHLNLDQVKEVVGSVVSGAKDLIGKGTSETKDLVENSPVGDAVKGLFGN